MAGERDCRRGRASGARRGANQAQTHAAAQRSAASFLRRDGHRRTAYDVTRLNQNAAEYLRREKDGHKSRRARPAKARRPWPKFKANWNTWKSSSWAYTPLRCFIRSANISTGHDDLKPFIVLVGSLLFLILTAWKLVPWERKPGQLPVLKEKPFQVLLVACAIWIAAIIWEIGIVLGWWGAGVPHQP